MTRTIGLSNAEITTLRDALNLGAEYLADKGGITRYQRIDTTVICKNCGRRLGIHSPGWKCPSEDVAELKTPNGWLDTSFDSDAPEWAATQD